MWSISNICCHYDSDVLHDACYVSVKLFTLTDTMYTFIVDTGLHDWPSYTGVCWRSADGVTIALATNDCGHQMK
jgi:hypothetical protein